MKTIDLNCDFGESFGVYQLDAQIDLLPYVSSVNIACGFHAGDPHVMLKSVRAALSHGVAIGAHPGLPDLQGFGRRAMQISPQEAYEITLYQIGALQAFVHSEGGKLHHVKPHGALYNQASTDSKLSEAIAKAIYKLDPTLILYGLSDSCLIEAGTKIGLPVKNEVFADRSYQDDGTLTPRSESGSVLSEASQVIEQVTRLVSHQSVKTSSGKIVPILADTLCIHGDGAHALSFAQLIQKVLVQLEVTISTES